MVSDLRGFARAGATSDYLETWAFTDDHHYVWTLSKKTPRGLKEEMGGTYTRK